MEQDGPTQVATVMSVHPYRNLAKGRCTRSEPNWGSLRNDGFKAAELYESGCNVFELRELFAMSRDGFSIRELFSSGCDFSDILEIGFVRSDFDREHLSCKELFDAGCRPSELLDIGFALPELKSVFSARKMRLAGFGLDALAAEYDANSLLKAGFDINAVIGTGLSIESFLQRSHPSDLLHVSSSAVCDTHIFVALSAHLAHTFAYFWGEHFPPNSYNL